MEEEIKQLRVLAVQRFKAGESPESILHITRQIQVLAVQVEEFDYKLR